MVILYPIALVVIGLLFFISMVTWGASAAPNAPAGLAGVSTGTSSQATTVPSTNGNSTPTTSTPATTVTTAPSGAPSELLQNASGGTTSVPLAVVQLAEAAVSGQFASSMTAQVAASSPTQYTLNISGTNSTGTQMVTTVSVVNKTGQWEIATGG